jgi:hypothetical protein
MWLFGSALLAVLAGSLGVLGGIVYRTAEDRPVWDLRALLLLLAAAACFGLCLWSAYTSAFVIINNM